MKGLLAVLIAISLLAACYVVSALIYFDLSWILIGITSLWAGIDSKKIELNRYKLGFACRPIAVFCVCYLLWIFVFPWYLWARFKIKAGTVDLKDETLETVGAAKSFFRWFSRVAERAAEWGLIGLVALKIAFLLVCIEENWRGQRTWENYRRELEAQGDTFDWNAMIPPPVPASQNVFSAPMMSKWFTRSSGGSNNDELARQISFTNTTAEVLMAKLFVVSPEAPSGARPAGVGLRYNDPAAHHRGRELIQSFLGPCAAGAQSQCLFVTNLPDFKQLKPLQIVLESDRKPAVKDLILLFNDGDKNTLAIKPDGTNSFQILASFCRASDYLQQSGRSQKAFDLLREALKRPYARMDGDYSYPPTIPLPNWAAVRAVVQTLAQRAQCYLLLGQPEKALAELALLNDSRRLVESAPTGRPMTLVSAIINAAVTALYADVVADGFRLHAWQEPQILVLQEQLQRIHLAPFMREAFREEEASMWLLMQTNVMAQFEIQRLPHATLLQKMRNLRPPNIIKGFWCLNMVNVAKLDHLAVASVDPDRRIVLTEKMAEFQRKEDAIGRHALPYNLFAAIAVPNYTKAVQTFAYNQTKADEAQIVCALERHRLAHGQYPETLNELAPQFIDPLPHDIIGGQPLKYRRLPDGQFLLYSVGWNGTDDGGRFYPPALDRGDWSWQ